MSDEYYDEEDELIEAYCVRCKNTIEIENPQPVWTRKGLPATRGDCPDCGGAVFRMGRTYLHDGHERPDAVELNSGLRGKLERDTVYVLYGQDDEAIAEQLAADLDIVGMAVWLHRHDEQTVQWAGGVHPALVQCKRMVLVLTDRTFQDTTLPQTWQYFRQNRKPIVIAQMMGGVTPPDEIRRSPRYDFTGDYKRAFREMLQVLSS